MRVENNPSVFCRATFLDDILGVKLVCRVRGCVLGMAMRWQLPSATMDFQEHPIIESLA